MQLADTPDEFGRQPRPAGGLWRRRLRISGIGTSPCAVAVAVTFSAELVGLSLFGILAVGRFATYGWRYLSLQLALVTAWLVVCWPYVPYVLLEGRGGRWKATMLGSYFWLPPLPHARSPIQPIVQQLAPHTPPLAIQEDELRPRHHRLQPRRPPLPGRVRHGGRPEGFDRRRSPGQGLRRPGGREEGPRQVSWLCAVYLCVMARRLIDWYLCGILA